jgi:hypothetical protein
MEANEETKWNPQFIIDHMAVDLVVNRIDNFVVAVTIVNGLISSLSFNLKDAEGLTLRRHQDPESVHHVPNYKRTLY